MQSHAVDPFGIVGQVLDSQFRVDRLVGEGGFSAVYRGHHVGLDEPIAIKCLKLPPSLSPALVEQFAKRFRDESRILYRLSQGNLNIVRSIAAGTWQANTGAVVPFMVLEWMEGRSLANELTIRRTVGHTGRPLAEVVKVFASAADGLAYAHSQGVVHRDLNPGNLFLASSPQGTRMKVLDFGVAKILDDSTLDIVRTQTVGQIRIFAPAYGAPEQFDDAIGKVGAASDVYSFALIVLEALRDRAINDGQHLGEFAHLAIDPNRRPTPRMFGIEVSDEVEQIFARATKLDPRERWQSAGELWRALTMAESAASKQKHVQAAMETPPLAMPQNSLGRSTKTGMAPPPDEPKKPGTPRMDKTLPIGALLPNRAPRPASPSNEEEEDAPTRVGARLVDPPMSEPEEELTKVRSPEEEAQLANAMNAMKTTPANVVPSPRAASPAAAPPRPPPAPDPPPSVPEPPPSGGTLLVAPTANPAHAGVGQAPGPTYPMHAPGHHAAPPHASVAKQQLAQTMPLMGPHPLGLPTQQPSSARIPAAGAPPPQHMPPPQQPAYAQPQVQAMAPGYPHQQAPHVQPQPMAQPTTMPGHGHPSGYGPHGAAPSVSLPPGSVAGVPKKKSPVLFIMLGLGGLALIGVVLIAVALGTKGHGKGAAAATSGEPPSASATSASAVAVTTETAPTAAPTAPVTEDAGVEAAKIDDTADASGAASASDSASDPASASASASASAAPSATATATTKPTSPTPTWTPPTPVAAKDAGPPADPNAYSEAHVRARLSQANGALPFCKKAGGVSGPGSAIVTVFPDGTVGMVTVNPPYANTPTGDCVAGQIKRVKVNPFNGGAQTLKHTFEVP